MQIPAIHVNSEIGRLKKVMLTEKGFEHHDHVVENFNKIHEEILGVLSQNEKELLLEFMEKISDHIEGGRKC